MLPSPCGPSTAADCAALGDAFGAARAAGCEDAWFKCPRVEVGEMGEITFFREKCYQVREAHMLVGEGCPWLRAEFYNTKERRSDTNKATWTI